MKKRDAPPHLLELMKRAAELRAAGASWETVANKVRRSPRTVRRWSERYRADWHRLFCEAADMLLDLAAGESLSILRKLLHTKEDWIGQNTGKFLYGMWRGLQQQQQRDQVAANRTVDPKWAAFIALLENMNEDEVKAFVTDWVARRLAPAGAAVPAGCGPSGERIAQ